jgi:hypothetical protein
MNYDFYKLHYGFKYKWNQLLLTSISETVLCFFLKLEFHTTTTLTSQTPGPSVCVLELNVIRIHGRVRVQTHVYEIYNFF